MATYFFASPVDVDVKVEGEEQRKHVDMKLEKERVVSCPVFYDGESVGGQVSLPFFFFFFFWVFFREPENPLACALGGFSSEGREKDNARGHQGGVRRVHRCAAHGFGDGRVGAHVYRALLRSRTPP
jgi:hypothetical protein